MTREYLEGALSYFANAYACPHKDSSARDEWFSGHADAEDGKITRQQADSAYYRREL